jgi:small subunit ribosomal protein S20
MPTTKSAAKRLRQSTIRRTSNRSLKHDLRTRCKRVASAVSEGDVQQAEAELRETTTKLDQAAAKGVIHRNAAARLKSRLSARIKAAKAKAAPKT